jgi:hypothetical protein
MGRLALHTLEFVRWVGDVAVSHRRRACATPAQRVPAGVELRPDALEPPVVLGGQAAMARGQPQPFLLLDQLLDSISYR